MNEKLNFKVFISQNEQSGLMLKDDELWLSRMPVDNSYQFEKEINSNSKLKTAYAVKYKRIEKLVMNPSDLSIKFFYQTVLGKNKSQSFLFSNKAESEFVLNHISNIRNFKRSEEKESISTPIVKYGIPLILVIVLLVMMNIYLPDGQVEVSGRKSIMKTIYNVIGKLGFTTFGSIVGLFLAYLLGKRILNPTNEIVYS